MVEGFSQALGNANAYVLASRSLSALSLYSRFFCIHYVFSFSSRSLFPTFLFFTLVAHVGASSALLGAFGAPRVFSGTVSNNLIEVVVSYIRYWGTTCAPHTDQASLSESSALRPIRAPGYLIR